jgi:hypothetical protein
LDGGEQIMQTDKLKDLGFSKSDEEGQGFGRLMLGDIAEWTTSEREEQLRMDKIDLQFGQTFHQYRRCRSRIQLSLHSDDDGLYVVNLDWPLLYAI